MIKPAPGFYGFLVGPLEAITTRSGDCKTYAIAKYAAVRVAESPQTTLGSWSCTIDGTVGTIWSPRSIKTTGGSFSIT